MKLSPVGTAELQTCPNYRKTRLFRLHRLLKRFDRSGRKRKWVSELTVAGRLPIYTSIRNSTVWSTTLHFVIPTGFPATLHWARSRVRLSPKERRMRSVNATKFHRKSGERSRGTCGAPARQTKALAVSSQVLNNRCVSSSVNSPAYGRQAQIIPARRTNRLGQELRAHC